MFLQCNLRASKVTFPDGATNPTKTNWFDFSCPVKSVSGSKSGPTMVASFLESINFRKGFPKKMTSAAIDSYIAKALAKDIALEEAGTIEDFVHSEDGYVTLESYLDALADDHKYIKGDVKWTTSKKVLKWMLQRYKCAIVETYLMQDFTTSPTSFEISSFRNTKALRKSYTKAWVAFGYDETGLIVLNSLGAGWGKLGFAKIAWSLLSQQVTIDDEGTKKKCFIKAAAFQGCFG